MHKNNKGMVDIIDYHLQRIDESICGVIVIDNENEAERLEKRLKEKEVYYELSYTPYAWNFCYDKKQNEKSEGLGLSGLIEHKIKNYKTGDALDLRIEVKEAFNFISGRKGIVSGFYLSDDGFLILKLDKEEVLKRQKYLNKEKNIRE